LFIRIREDMIFFSSIAGSISNALFFLHHFSKGHCSVAIAILLSGAMCEVLTRQPQWLQDELLSSNASQTWQCVSKITAISLSSRTGRPALIHRDNARV